MPQYFDQGLDVQQPFGNTLDEIVEDSYVGLSWEVSVGAGNQVTRSNYTQVTIP